MNLLTDPSTRRILEQLLRDARQSMRQLSAAVGLSPPAVTDRVRRLEDLGIIRGYKPVLDHSKLGWNVTAFLYLTARDGRCDLIIDKISSIPNVIAAYHIAGEVDYLARIAATDLEELKAITDEIAQVAAVSSQIVLGTDFERDLL